MKDIQERIRMLATENRQRSRVIAFLLALSLTIIFVMPMLTAQSGFTIRNNDLNNGIEYMEEALTSIPSGSTNMNGHITGLTVNGQSLDNGSITIDAGDANSVNLNLGMTFEFESAAEVAQIVNNSYIYYQLDSNIKLTNAIYGTGQCLEDASWSHTKKAGYFSVSQDGLLVIRFTNEYVEYLNGKSNMQGDVSFKSYVNRGETASGDVQAYISGYEINVTFKDAEPSLSKNGSVRHENNNYYVDWTLSVYNPQKVVDLSQYSLTDTLNGTQIDWSQVNPAFNPPGSASVENGQIRFVNPSPSETITINYSTPAALDGNYDNRASLTGSGKTYSAQKEIRIENGLDVTKTGTPGYQLTDLADDKVRWEIEVSHKSGDSLHNVTVTEKNYDFGNVKVYDSITGAELSANSYTVNGRTLTFGADTSIPSKVKIVFTADAANLPTDAMGSVELENKVEAGRSGDIEPKEFSANPPVYYQNTFLFQKQNSVLNQETGTLEWQFNLRANATDQYGNKDWNSKRSINGYKITDAAFAQLTDAEIQSKIGFNLFNNDTQVGDSRNGSLPYGFELRRATVNETNDTLVIYFNEDAQDYDKDHPLNAIKLYYHDSIEDYMTKNGQSAQYTNYLNGQQATLTNTADGSDGRSISVHEEVIKQFQQEVSAVKNYEHADNNEFTSSGQEDQDDRVLTWSGTMSKGLGFREGDYYVDVLSSSLNGVPHYITPEQRSLTLQGRTLSTEAAETLDSSMYTVTFYKDAARTQAAGDDENAVAFRIDFTSAVNEKKYHGILFSYNTTAETTAVQNGQSAQFINSCALDQQNPTQSAYSPTYYRSDPQNVQMMSLKVKKTWSDNNNLFGTRPETIRVRLYQAEVDSSGGIPAADSEAWTEYAGSPYTLNVNKNNNETTYELGSDFPQWRYDADTGTGIRYCYRIEEDAVTGYELTAVSDPFVAHANWYDLNLTNTNEQSFGKFALNAANEQIQSIDRSSIPKATVQIDGTATECYMFHWAVAFGKGDTAEYTDTLPEHAVYITGTEPGMTNYQPYIFYSTYNNFSSRDSLASHNITAAQSGRTLTFRNVNSAVEGFLYYIAIPVSELEGVLDNGNLVNTLSRDSGTPVSASLKINGSGSDDHLPPITKGSFAANAGYLVYYIDFNPEGRKLSNTGMVDISDALAFRSETGDVSISDLEITLDSIDVYPLEDGVPDTHNPLNGSQYSYNSLYNTEQTKELPGSVWTVENGRKVWKNSVLEPGDHVYFTLKYDSLPTYQTALEFKMQSQNEYKSLTIGDVRSQMDENGVVTVDLTVPPIAGAAVYTLEDYSWPFEIQSASIHSTVPALLDLSVPDQTPLRVQYTYLVTGWTAETTGLKFRNTAYFEADNDAGSSSTDWYEMSTSGGGHVEVLRRPKIYKSDVSNEALNDLSAQFKVAKYNTTTHKWEYASAVQINNTNQDEAYRSFVFPETPITETGQTYPDAAGTLVIDSDLPNSFDLVDGGLYKFVEITAPEGYRQPNWNNGFAGNEEFVFYFSYGHFEGTPPADAAGKIEAATKKVINIKNSRNISISAVKSFSGSPEDIPAQAQVTLGLYWSYSKKGTNLLPVSSDHLSVPADFVRTKTVTYRRDGSGDASVEWTGLPTGKGHDPVYYFVQEESYTIGGHTYTFDEASGTYVSGSETGKFRPVYTRNGTNTDGTEIEVNNSEGIMVRKLWVDVKGKPVVPPNDVSGSGKMEVGFKVYGILGNDRIELDLPVKKLTYENGYEYVLPSSVQGTNGTAYQLTDFDNYEIAEALTAEQLALLEGNYLAPLTTRKITNKTGVLEIINTSTASPETSASVTKVWRDSNADHSADSLTFELLQSTDPNLTTEQLAAYADGGAVSGLYSMNTFRSTEDVKVIPIAGAKSFTFAGQTISSVSGAESGCTVSYSGDTLTISGTAESSSDLVISFTDGTQESFTATVIPFEVTLGGQNWSKTWNRLPYCDSETGQNYYYYVIEHAVPDQYSVSYQRTDTVSGQQITVTNSLPTTITIQKLWKDGDGNIIITDTADPAYNAAQVSALPETISVQVFRKVKTASDQTNVNMPGSSADPTDDFGGAVNFGSYTLNRSEGYRLELTDLDAVNSSGEAFIYYFKESGTHVLNGSSYQLNGKPQIEGVTYTNNGLTADAAAQVTITNQIATVGMSVIKQWNDDKNHTNDTVTVRIHRETAADSGNAQLNSLILSLNVPAESTVQIPLGESFQITANMPVRIEATENAPVGYTTDSSRKVWTLTPAAGASAGDTAELNFVAEDGQTVSITVEIVSAPTLELTLDKLTLHADEAAPTVASVVFTPAGGANPTDVKANAVYSSTNAGVIEIDAQTGVMTVIGVGTAEIQATYTVNGKSYSDKKKVTVSLPDTFAITGESSVNAGSTVQLAIDKPFGTFTWRSSDDAIATVDANGLVTGVAEGTVTITAERSDGATATKEIEVSSAQNLVEVLNNLPYKPGRLNAGDTFTVELRGTPNTDFNLGLKGNDPNGEWKQQQVPANTYQFDSEGKFVLTVTADYDYVDPVLEQWHYSGSGSIQYVSYEQIVTLDLNTITDSYYFDAGRLYSIHTDSPIKAIYRTYGSHDNVSVNGSTPGHWVQISFAEGSNSFTLTVPGANLHWGESVTVETGAGTKVFQVYSPAANSAPSQTRTLMRRFSAGALRMGAAEAYTEIPLAAPAQSGETEAPAFSSTGTFDVTLQASGQWTTLITGLPVYTAASDGTVYTNYYWAEEIAVNGVPVAGYQTAYTFTDGDSETAYTVNAAQPGEAPSIVIRNTPVEDEGVELPVSGGKGTAGYYLAGGMLLLLSAAGYIMKQSRGWKDE